jgi:hypothetical protein
LSSFCLCLAFLSRKLRLRLPLLNRPFQKSATWVANEKTITKLEQDWFKIQLARDWDNIHPLLGEDFQLIESDGSLPDAASMTAGCQDEATRVVTISITLRVAHAVTDDCVVATGFDDINEHPCGTSGFMC